MSTAPLQFLLMAFAGWVNRRQLAMIDYLKEENPVLGNDGVTSATGPTSAGDRHVVETPSCGDGWVLRAIYPVGTTPMLRFFNMTLVAQARRKYRRLERRQTWACLFLARLAKGNPHLFERGMVGTFA